MFRNVRLAFGTILENIRKSSEGGRKSSENHQKSRHQHVYIINRTLHGGLNFIFSWQKQYFTLLPLENKIHSFVPRCNILYMFFFFQSSAKCDFRMAGLAREYCFPRKNCQSFKHNPTSLQKMDCCILTRQNSKSNDSPLPAKVAVFRM